MDEFQAKLLEALDRIADEIGELKDEMVKNHEGLTTTLSTAMDLAEEGQKGQQAAIKSLADSQDGVASAISAIDQTVQDLVRRMPQ